MSDISQDREKRHDHEARSDFRRRCPERNRPLLAAVRAGEFVFVCGQPGFDAGTGQPSDPTFGEQARQASRNLDAVLRASGSRPELVVITTVLVADASAFAELNELYAEFFPSEPPARMTMQVPLPQGVLFSIGRTALVES